LASGHLQKQGVSVHRSLTELANYQFDFIIANHVIEHISEPEQTLKLLIDLLKPGGKILIGTPDFLGPSALFFRERYRMLEEPTHISFFSLDSLLRLIRYLGLEVEEVKMPFWESPYFQSETFQIVLFHEKYKVSPPFPGNFLLVTAKRIKVG
jgi:2-polyprenyl-3-methyl-5-hydroxy-6-metoxy-1,4-benzoquinol methylase